MNETREVIRFYRDSKYGNDLMYAVDQQDAISRLTGRKTLIKSDMDALKDLGFEFKEVLKSEVI